MAQKAFTNYECASGNVGLGHSSLYTGARPSERDDNCLCGQPLVEVVADGYRYKVVFESVSPHQAAELKAQYGRGIWPRLSDEEWESLKWLPPVTSEQGSANVLRDQYKRLLDWSRTREQPIRNVKFFRAQGSEWEEITT
jgi:hypothetical protein